MSDFLTHLASRSVDQLPLVQPRLASRFEAQSAFSRTDLEGLNPKRLDSAHLELTELSPEEGPPDRPSIGSPQPRSKEYSSRLNGSTQPPPNAARSPEHLSELRPENGVLETHSSQPRSPETANLIEPSIVSPQPLVPFSALSNTSLQPSVQPLGSPGDPRSREASHDADSLMERQDKFSQNPQPASTGPSSIQLQPQITPRIEPSLLGFPAATPPPPPTIHVTIGRIEVRAHTAAASAKPAPRSPAPALTLNQYLSQRSGGQI
jgi:hypothetical protein